jgi:CYTH domain-containing protein
MEIERKFLVRHIPYELDTLKCRMIEQGYLSTTPVVRVRRDNESFYLTYKSAGLMEREEYNLPLTKESYEHLLAKADGIIISKSRYEIPMENGLIIELDLFHGDYEGFILAEVEFPSTQEANAFTPPEWFGEDVTFDKRYHNSNMSHSLIRF